MKKQLGLAFLAIVGLNSWGSEQTANKEKPKAEKTKKKKPAIKSEFNWQWPDTREQAVSSCSQYLAFMRPKIAQLSGESQAHFQLHLDFAEALLKHLQAIHKKHGFRMDAKRCRSELIRAERVLMYHRRKNTD